MEFSKDLINDIDDLLWDIKQDLHKATIPGSTGKANKSAAQRVRVNSVRLERYFKIYRKESVLKELHDKNQFRFDKMYPNAQKSKPYPEMPSEEWEVPKRKLQKLVKKDLKE